MHALPENIALALEAKRARTHERHADEMAAVAALLTKECMSKPTLARAMSRIGFSIGIERLAKILQNMGDTVYVEHMEGDGKPRTPAFRFGTPPQGYVAPLRRAPGAASHAMLDAIARRNGKHKIPSYTADPMLGFFFAGKAGASKRACHSELMDSES